MTGPERVRVFHDAIEILLLRQVNRTKPTNPDGYMARARGLKRRDYQAEASEIMDEYPGIEAEGLADMLEPEPPAPVEPINTSSLLPNVSQVIGPPVPLTDDERSRSRERIAEIRTLLAKGGEKGEHT